jgi:stringent starvation protein B
MDNDAVVFSARFGGVSQNMYIPMNAVKGIFARENGQGMFFEVSDEPAEVDKSEANTSADPQQPSKNKKPTLTIVK